MAVAVVVVLGRIFAVAGPFGPNDFSRWGTVAALLETGDYGIGHRVEEADGTHRDLKAPVMIDVLLHPKTKVFYSSKPPLLPTLLALEAKLLDALFGWSAKEQGARVLRLLLATFNGLPLLLYLLAFALVLQRLDAGEGATAALLVTAGFGTFATTFANTITNHVPATAAAGLALFALVRLWHGDRRPRLFLLVGFATGVTASQEIPGLALLPAVAFPLFLLDGRKTVAFFLPAFLVPMIGFVVTNQQALGEPFYFYRPDPIWSQFPGSYWTNRRGIDAGEASHLAYVLHFTLGHHGVLSLSPIFFFAALGMARPFSKRPASVTLVAVAGMAVTVLLRYAYKRWNVPLPVVMSLPAVGGALALAHPWGWWKVEERRRELVPRVALCSTMLTLSFYLIHTSNYGGVSSGPRWVMWLTPFWLAAALLPVERALRDRRGRFLVVAAVLISVFSASYPISNPWVHPWLYALTQ